MRIVHAMKHSFHSNGNVHVAVDLACAQAQVGHDVTFHSGGGSFDELLRSHGVRVVSVGRGPRVRGTVTAAMSLYRQVVRLDADIVHAHMMSSAVLGYIVTRLSAAKLITTVHNSFDRHSGLMRLGDVVVAVSEAERQSLVSRGFGEKKVVTVLNGAIESPRENLGSTPPQGFPQPSVIALSGLHKRKAVDDVIRAFAAVASEYPTWSLVIVGDGPDRSFLEALAETYGLGERIRFLGTSITPRVHLERASIFVTATLADPCPLAVAEARAAGCAVIGTAVGGIPELLGHGASGILVRPQNLQEISAALRNLMGSRSDLLAWQERAVSGIEHLTVNRMANDYLAVYEDVLKQRVPL